MVAKGTWSLKKALSDPVMTGTRDGGMGTMTTPSMFDKSLRESRASRRRSEGRRRGSEARGRVAKRATTQFSAMGRLAKRAKPLSALTRSPYGRSKLGLSLRSRAMDEISWALGVLTTQVYTRESSAVRRVRTGNPKDGAPDLTLDDLPEAILDDIIGCVRDLCIYDDLHLILSCNDDPHASLPAKDDLYFSTSAARVAAAPYPSLLALLDLIDNNNSSSTATTTTTTTTTTTATTTTAEVAMDIEGQASEVEQTPASSGVEAAYAACVEAGKIGDRISTFEIRHKNLKAAFNVLRLLSLEEDNVPIMTDHTPLVSTLARVLPKLPEDILPLGAETLAQLASEIRLPNIQPEAEAIDADAETTESTGSEQSGESEPKNDEPSIAQVAIDVLKQSDDARVIRSMLETIALLAGSHDNRDITRFGPSLYLRVFDLISVEGISGLITVLGLRTLNAFCALDLAPRVDIAKIPGALQTLIDFLDPAHLQDSFVPFAAQQLLLHLVGAPANRALFRPLLDSIFAPMSHPSSPFHDLGQLVCTELSE